MALFTVVDISFFAIKDCLFPRKFLRTAVKKTRATSFFAVESSSQLVLYCGSLAHSIVKGMRHNAVCAIKEHTHATKVILLKTCTPHCGYGYVA